MRFAKNATRTLESALEAPNWSTGLHLHSTISNGACGGQVTHPRRTPSHRAQRGRAQLSTKQSHPSHPKYAPNVHSETLTSVNERPANTWKHRRRQMCALRAFEFIAFEVRTCATFKLCYSITQPHTMMAFAYARAPSIATRVAPTDFGIARRGFRCVGTGCLFAKTLNNLHQLTGNKTATLSRDDRYEDTHRGARTHDHKVKSLALCRLR